MSPTTYDDIIDINHHMKLNKKSDYFSKICKPLLCYIFIILIIVLLIIHIFFLNRLMYFKNEYD